MISKFLIPILVFMSISHLWAKTVIVPKRETAKTYYLSLKNLSTQESLKLESKNGKFELPEDLNGDFSLQISFSDKWGRIINGQDPKIIKITTKIKEPEKLPKGSIEDKVAAYGLIFTPYMSQGSFQADLGDNSSGITKIKDNLTGYGIRTILKITSQPKYLIGLERFQATSPKADLNFTEASIHYQFMGQRDQAPGLSADAGIAFNSAQINGGFKDGEDTVHPEIQASSAYAAGHFSLLKKIASLDFQTHGMLGLSINYFRYCLSQSAIYRFSPRLSAGPWLDYTKFANGNDQGKMTANLMSVGIKFNLSL